MTATAPPDRPTFYITGGTLPAGAPSYVERQADRDLLAALRQGEYCYVLHAHQMGKSSLCVRAIARLWEEGVRTVFLDLTKFGARNLTAEQWYAASSLDDEPLIGIGRLREHYLRVEVTEGGASPRSERISKGNREP